MDIGFFDDFALAVLMRNPPADRLIAQPEVAVQPVRRRPSRSAWNRIALSRTTGSSI
jgi:hypothetical protein